MNDLKTLDRLIKLESLRNLSFATSKSQKLIKDFTDYFEKKNQRFTSVEMFRAVHWYEIYDDLKRIFCQYYLIEKDEEQTFIVQNLSYSGGFIKLNPNYKERFVKDVRTIYIINAYPQKIDKMFVEGMKVDDPYLPFIFHLVFRAVKEKTQLRKIFINYFYGLLISDRSKFNVNRNLSEISKYYHNVWNSIDSNLYYYIDTDFIMFNRKNQNKIIDILNNFNVEFEIEDEKYDVLFLNIKKYIKIKDGQLFKTKGLKSYDNQT